MKPPVLKLPLYTEQLEIRRAVPTDADSYFSLQVDPDYVQFVGQLIDRERFDHLFETLLGDDPNHLSLAVCRTSDGELIGEVVLVPSSPREVEMVISIALKHRKHGYALEAARAVSRAALETDGVSVVMVCVEDENEASLRLVRSLRMTRVGRTERLGGKNPTVFVLRRGDAGNAGADGCITP